ncbi:MAG: alpha/beta hydrolase [Clostridiales bacterium]|nr:alpha/beta hydrolase [Clostridiales bacterium]
MTYPKIKVLKNNPELKGLALLVPDVTFSTATGVELKMQILMPWQESTEGPEAEMPQRPLIVFLQGSGWTFPDVNYEIPQLAEYARRGYVVATITHRNYKEGHPAPAFLQDAKTAIRFLRKHADIYGIDPSRVCFWGTSSGGNTAMLVAMTGDDPKYKTSEYAQYSDSVSLAIQCFGPTDLVELVGDRAQASEIQSHFDGFVGGSLSDNMSLLKEMSPFHIIDRDKDYPPLLILHGDADELVPYEQGEKMFKALVDNGKEVEMIRVENAPHEGSFWSCELHGEIMDFLKGKL